MAKSPANNGETLGIKQNSYIRDLACSIRNVSDWLKNGSHSGAFRSITSEKS